MKIFVTGAAGFVGSYIIRQIADDGHTAHTPDVDITSPDSLRGTIDGCDALIHLVGIIEEIPSRGITFERIHGEGTRNVVEAAVESGISTFVHMSANGARADGISAYQTGKWEGEEAVRGAGFKSATIFRPSLLFGRPVRGRREFTSDLLRQLIKPFPVLPIFGDGRYELQPVAVQSVARAFVSAAVEARPGLHEYPVAGPDTIPYEEVVDIITEASGRSRKPKINVPVVAIRLGIDLFGWTGLLPITSDQLNMLLEGNTCPHEPFHSDFGIDPVPFNAQTLDYLSNL